MSHKARRRPSWKADKNQQVFYIHLLNEEDDTLWERVCLKGRAAKNFNRLIAIYGEEETSKMAVQMLINAANDVLLQEKENEI
jgi:hypothetical protein